MQFANDITPLTLASTARLQASLGYRNLNSTERAGIRAEIDSRSPSKSLLAKETEISLLRSEVADLESDLEDEEKECDQAKKTLELAIEKLKENDIEFEP